MNALSNYSLDLKLKKIRSSCPVTLREQKCNMYVNVIAYWENSDLVITVMILLNTFELIYIRGNFWLFFTVLLVKKGKMSLGMFL